jgi:hypothetical protein
MGLEVETVLEPSGFTRIAFTRYENFTDPDRSGRRSK